MTYQCMICGAAVPDISVDLCPNCVMTTWLADIQASAGDPPVTDQERAQAALEYLADQEAEQLFSEPTDAERLAINAETLKHLKANDPAGYARLITATNILLDWLLKESTLPTLPSAE